MQYKINQMKSLCQERQTVMKYITEPYEHINTNIFVAVIK